MNPSISIVLTWAIPTLVSSIVNGLKSELDMVMLLLTDILNEGSEILVTGAKPEIVEKAFNVTLKDKGAFLPGVLSRKKLVVPPITNAITA